MVTKMETVKTTREVGKAGEAGEVGYDIPNLTVEQQTCLIARRMVEILQDPSHWTKGNLARGRWGSGVSVQSEEAQSFCLVGSIHRAAYDLGIKLDTSTEDNPLRRLDHSLTRIIHLHPRGGPSTAITGFNDRERTTHADVLDVVKINAKAVCVSLPGDECMEDN